MVALLGSLVLKDVQVGGHPLPEAKQATLVSLGLGAVLALAVAMPMLKAPPLAPVDEARRLLDTIGWAAVLPQALAALGAVFALAGVGHVVGDLFVRGLPPDSRLAVVCAYTLGMAAFTQVAPDTSYAFLLGALFVMGLGMGGTMMPIMSAALAMSTIAIGAAVAPATAGVSLVQAPVYA